MTTTEDEKNVNLIWFLSFLLAITIFTGIAHFNEPDYYYRAYLLQDQYIGDIEGCEDVLIMDVIVLSFPDGELDLFYDDKYAFNLCTDGHIEPQLNFVATKQVSRLYFANENQIRTDLKDDTVIVARWKNNLIRADVISGVETFTTDTYFW